MSDDLVKRLHSLHKQATVERSHFYVGRCAKDAIDRIEELEAKLAKALRALERIEVSTDAREQGAIAMATLAKLKGQGDE